MVSCLFHSYDQIKQGIQEKYFTIFLPAWMNLSTRSTYGTSPVVNLIHLLFIASSAQLTELFKLGRKPKSVCVILLSQPEPELVATPKQVHYQMSFLPRKGTVMVRFSSVSIFSSTWKNWDKSDSMQIIQRSQTVMCSFNLLWFFHEADQICSPEPLWVDRVRLFDTRCFSSYYAEVNGLHVWAVETTIQFLHCTILQVISPLDRINLQPWKCSSKTYDRNYIYK
jgi:hypothetical protein